MSTTAMDEPIASVNKAPEARVGALSISLDTGSIKFFKSIGRIFSILYFLLFFLGQLGSPNGFLATDAIGLSGSLILIIYFEMLCRNSELSQDKLIMLNLIPLLFFHIPPINLRLTELFPNPNLYFQTSIADSSVVVVINLVMLVMIVLFGMKKKIGLYGLSAFMLFVSVYFAGLASTGLYLQIVRPYSLSLQIALVHGPVMAGFSWLFLSTHFFSIYVGAKNIQAFS